MSHLACTMYADLTYSARRNAGWAKGRGIFQLFQWNYETEAGLVKSRIPSFYFQSEHVKSPYRSTYVSFKAFSEKWDVHQNKIPQLMTFFILVTSLLANV